MDAFLSTEGLLALVTLTFLEVILGVDNVIFISILSGKLPQASQAKARQTGLFLAMFMRIGLLASLAWVIRLTAPMFTLFGNEISGRDLILIGGGLFLLAKATLEIHEGLEGTEHQRETRAVVSFGSVIVQIMLLDIVFSLDSVITAIGMAKDLAIMIAAVVLAVVIMMATSGPIGSFVQRHPTVKILALSFLLLIGLSLIGDGLDVHIPKGYVYFAMGFSMFVEAINLRVRGKTSPVKLHEKKL